MKTTLVLSICSCLVAAAACLPVYGTTRYGRMPYPYRAAPAYYGQPYPFAQTYPENLYYRPDPIVHYPYYSVNRPYAKNDIYQTMYPYYYSDRLLPYGYYGNDDTYLPTDDPQDAVHDEDLRNGDRTEALPVGQETWFEGESVPRWQNDYDDVNAAFLQNLIMSQMYNDAMAKNDQIPTEKTITKQQENDDYEDRRPAEYYGERDTRDFEDEDVRELKALAGKPLYHVPKTNVYSNDKNYRQQQWQHDFSTPSAVRREEQHDHYDDYPNDEAWINWGNKRDSKTVKIAVKTTLAPPTTTMVTSTKIPSPVTLAGQKEEVLLRPATPVRHPFAEPVMQMLAANVGQKKRTPSVYDTIKQLLSMEESYAPVS